MKRSRKDDGRFDSQPAFPDEEFLDAVDRLDEPTTGDVARSVGCARTTAHERLRELEDDGRLSSRRVGNALVWALNSF